jgi:transposase
MGKYEQEIILLKEEIQKLKEGLESKDKEILALQDLVAQLRRFRFKGKSEKVSNEELGMFDEVEATNDSSDEIDDIEVEDEPQINPTQKKRRGKRLRLPEHLPRIERVIDLDDKKCPIDHEEMICIGEEISEKLEVIPAKVRVIRTIRKKYACKKCEAVAIGPVANDILPKSNASSSLLAYIAVAKYADHLPLHRQEAIFQRAKIDLTRQTMARWMILAGEKVGILVKLLREELLKSTYIHMDETSIQVLKEKDRPPDSQSYIWVQAKVGAHPIILFHYAETRKGEHARELLGDYRGLLQVDGYDGYASICRDNDITRLGCWAHARRKFFDAFKSKQGNTLGKQGLVFIKKIYEIEAKIREKSVEERTNERHEKSKPIVANFKLWLDQKSQTVTPSSIAGRAIHYAINEWKYLVNCFEHGEAEIDNNYIEAHIRPFTIGRKNWLFAATPEGAAASANLYSLIETARANDLNPFEYLNNVFEKLPDAHTEQALLKLLPIPIS